MELGAWKRLDRWRSVEVFRSPVIIFNIANAHLLSSTARDLQWNLRPASRKCFLRGTDSQTSVSHQIRRRETACALRQRLRPCDHAARSSPARSRVVDVGSRKLYSSKRRKRTSVKLRDWNSCGITPNLVYELARGRELNSFKRMAHELIIGRDTRGSAAVCHNEADRVLGAAPLQVFEHP